MLRIGTFARMGRVSVKALRHYDVTGLLRPARVDPDTGYRHYSAAQLPTLNRILIYKNLGFSLDQTRAFLDRSCSPARLRELLEARHQELARRIEIETVQLTEVMSRIRHIEREETGVVHDVVIRETEPCQVVSVRRILPDYSALDSLLLSMRRTAPNAEIQAQGAIWHRCASPGESIDCEALLILKRACASSRILGGQMVASVACRASEVDPFPEVYRAVREKADAAGYEILRPMREIYYSNDATEIQFPVRKLNGGESHAA